MYNKKPHRAFTFRSIRANLLSGAIRCAFFHAMINSDLFEATPAWPDRLTPTAAVVTLFSTVQIPTRPSVLECHTVTTCSSVLSRHIITVSMVALSPAEHSLPKPIEILLLKQWFIMHADAANIHYVANVANIITYSCKRFISEFGANSKPLMA